MKRIKKNIILLFIITIIILYFILKDEYESILSALLNSNLVYVFLMIIVMFIAEFIKSISLYLITKSSKKNYEFKNSLRLELETNFFNGVTPFSLGGQPFQLYVLKKTSNIDYTTGANILFKDYYSYQMALMFLGIIFVVLDKVFNILTMTSVVGKFMLIGFIINIIITVLQIYLPFSRGSGKKLVNKLVGFLSKIKIIKDREKSEKKLNDSIEKFKVQIHEIAEDPKLMIKCSLLNLIRFLLFGLLTYLSFKAVNLSGINVMVATIAMILITIMSSFVPIPGASGGMEFGYIAIFSAFVGGPSLTAAMILWRFVHYYLPMIFGSILFVFEKRE